jgi:hypothetical protein
VAKAAESSKAHPIVQGGAARHSDVVKAETNRFDFELEVRVGGWQARL